MWGIHPTTDAHPPPTCMRLLLRAVQCSSVRPPPSASGFIFLHGSSLLQTVTAAWGDHFLPNKRTIQSVACLVLLYSATANREFIQELTIPFNWILDADALVNFVCKLYCAYESINDSLSQHNWRSVCGIRAEVLELFQSSSSTDCPGYFDDSYTVYSVVSQSACVARSFRFLPSHSNEYTSVIRRLRTIITEAVYMSLSE